MKIIVAICAAISQVGCVTFHSLPVGAGAKYTSMDIHQGDDLRVVQTDGKVLMCRVERVNEENIACSTPTNSNSWVSEWDKAEFKIYTDKIETLEIQKNKTGSLNGLGRFVVSVIVFVAILIVYASTIGPGPSM